MTSRESASGIARLEIARVGCSGDEMNERRGERTETLDEIEGGGKKESEKEKEREKQRERIMCERNDEEVVPEMADWLIRAKKSTAENTFAETWGCVA